MRTLKEIERQIEREIEKLKFENEKAVKARHRAIKELKELDLSEFRDAMNRGLAILFYNNGEFAKYGIDSMYQIQYDMNLSYRKTKEELQEQIERSIQSIIDTEESSIERIKKFYTD